MRFNRVLVTGAGGMLGRHVVAALRGYADVTGFDLRRGADDIPWRLGELTDRAAVAGAVAGHDAVVHIAAVPNIVAAPADRIIDVNVTGTWNMLQAAAEAGVRRVVLCSSDSVVGFTVLSGRMLPPLYLPVDELHPLRPTDPYALSKKLGEEAGRGFADAGAFEVVVLRPVFVAYPEMKGEIRARARDPSGYRWPAAGGPAPAGGGAVWHHVDPRDVARAFRLALELPSVRFDAFFVSAAVTLAPEPTLERLHAYLGGLPEVQKPEVYRDNPYAPLYDLARARDILGFTPYHDARAWVTDIRARARSG